MEYIRPLTRPSLLQRAHALWRDVAFVLACISRFIQDHLSDPCHPQPQAYDAQEHHTQRDGVPFYRQTEAERLRSAQQRQRQEDDLLSKLQQQDADDEAEAVAAGRATLAAHPAVPACPPEVRVLCQNLWGLPISPCVHLRAQELSKSLHLFDLVAFQELTHERELKWLRAYCRTIGLRHCHQFSHGVGFPIWHGVTAPSLVLFSRFPILDIVFKRFSINGKMYSLAHSDYMGAKGVGLVRVDVSELVYAAEARGCRPVVGVDVFLTHLHANYTDFFYDYRKWMPLVHEYEAREERVAAAAGKAGLTLADDASLRSHLPIPPIRDIADEYLAHRVLQSFELARFIAAQRRPDFLTLLCGDLNSPPYDLCIQLIQSVSLGQSPGCVPRLIDAFAQLHPNSHGFTCGSTDNSFTFSTEPLRMERRALSGSSSSATATTATQSSARPLSPSARHLDSSTECELDSLRRRNRFNSSPTDPALIPSDMSVRASRSYGEHVLLLASTQANAPRTPPNEDSSDSAAVTDGAKAAASRATGVADAAASRVQSPLAWCDAHTPKRIDYVFYSNPVRPMQCRCQWAQMQLPFQQLASDDAEVLAAARHCTCAPHLSALPSPQHLWRCVSASIFKQYVLESDGRMTSISDHHGVSITMQLQKRSDDSNGERDKAQATRPAAQHTSTILISQHTPRDAPASASSPSPPSFPASLSSPRLPLRKLPIMRDGRQVGEERDLYTLVDEAGWPFPSESPEAAMDGSSSAQDPEGAPGPSSAASSPSSFASFDPPSQCSSPLSASLVPPLPTSTLLLLASGVLWLGLRDATARRAAHVRRMWRAGVIFVVGSRSMWLWLFNLCFENMWDAYLVPSCLSALTLPPLLLSFLRFGLLVIDWAHTFLPIYIVIEWLLTTFPAKEEQSAMRENIAEINTLRRFATRQERERTRTRQKRQQQEETQ